jgi:hypothetical protein
VHSKANDGKTVHQVTFKDVQVDGFWSISVYNAKGYFEKNALRPGLLEVSRVKAFGAQAVHLRQERTGRGVLPLGCHKRACSGPTWGAPRIVGELWKLGIDVAKSTVEKYRMRPRKLPSPSWNTFLTNHVQDKVGGLHHHYKRRAT